MSLEPGRELDALIAEKVMGLKEVKTADEYFDIQNFRAGDFFGKKYFCSVKLWNETFSGHRPGRTICVVSGYSTDIAAAWSVIDELKNKRIQRDSYTDILTAVHVHFEGDIFEVVFIDQNHNTWAVSKQKTLPHAICVAALKALGLDE